MSIKIRVGSTSIILAQGQQLTRITIPETEDGVVSPTHQTVLGELNRRALFVTEESEPNVDGNTTIWVHFYTPSRVVQVLSDAFRDTPSQVTVEG